MRKKILYLATLLIISLLTATLLSACGGEPQYCGKYSGPQYDDTSISITVDNITISGSSQSHGYTYDSDENSFTLQNGKHFYIDENNTVLYDNEYKNPYESKVLLSRNGYINATMFTMTEDKDISKSLTFTTDGKYKMTDYFITEIGTYIVRSGLVVFMPTGCSLSSFEGGSEIIEHPTKKYAYIDNQFNYYSVAYIKDNSSLGTPPNPPVESSYLLCYDAEGGGYIFGQNPQIVENYGDGFTVSAIAHDGYRFDRWSDGVMTATRKDTAITENTQLTAYFTSAPTDTYTLFYSVLLGGTITGSASQTVESGGNGSEVTAVADDGYTFTGWSDGVTTATRHDKNVTKNITVTAVFLPTSSMVHTISYRASIGGKITGATQQLVQHGNSGTAVTAVANEGYIFFGWSDERFLPTRQDVNVTQDITATAVFIPLTTTGDIINFAGGWGTPQDPYKVATLTHLKNIEKFPTANYVLISNIDLPLKNDGSSNFAPLCSEDIPFNGSLDGKSFTIKNLSIIADGSYCGLFTVAGAQSQISNLSITNAKITAQNYGGILAGLCLGTLTSIKVQGEIKLVSVNTYNIVIGGVAGRAENTAANCVANVSINVENVAPAANIGGLFGYFSSTATDCNSTALINATGVNSQLSIGGLVGTTSRATIENCYSTGAILTTNATSQKVGGLIGNQQGDIQNCYANTNIDIKSNKVIDNSSYSYIYIGSIAGYTNVGTISNCYSTGTLSLVSSSGTNATSYLGGISGRGVTITNCYSTANLVAENHDGTTFVGGIAGEGMDGIKNCYSTGTITLANNEEVLAGGIVGQQYSEEIKNCYSTVKITGLETSTNLSESFAGGIAGKTRSDSKTNNTHWLLYGDSSAKFGVGYSDNYGLPSNVGAKKYLLIGSMYNLADILNGEQTAQPWKDVENSTPQLDLLIKPSNS